LHFNTYIYIMERRLLNDRLRITIRDRLITIIIKMQRGRIKIYYIYRY